MLAQTVVALAAAGVTAVEVDAVVIAAAGVAVVGVAVVGVAVDDNANSNRNKTANEARPKSQLQLLLMSA